MLVVIFGHYIFDSDLPVFSGVADVLRMRSLNVRILPLKRVDNVPGFIQAESGLSEVCDAIRIWNGQHLYFLWTADHLGHIRRLPQRADNLIVVAMANYNQRVALLGKVNGFYVDLC